MKNPSFYSNTGIYHIYNRGVEKRDIFLEDADYWRFIHDLYEFNDADSIGNTYRRATQLFEVEPRTIGRQHQQHQRELLVEIFAFCLMKNHYHLLVRQRKENGIPIFMQKLGTGYTMYFNEKNDRVGSLLQGRYKAVQVDDDAHFLWMPTYIHFNPLDYYVPEWREQEIRDPRKALAFLMQYRWSSFSDYMGVRNIPSVTSREFLLKCFGGHEAYKQDTIKLLQSMKMEKISHLTLE